MQRIIDDGIFKRDLKQIFSFIIVYFILSILQTGTMHFVNIQFAIISKQYSLVTKKKVFDILKKFDGMDIQNIKGGKIVHIIEDDIDDISFNMTEEIFQLLNDIFTAIFSFIMLLYISPVILAIILVLQSSLLYINKILSNKINKLNKQNFSMRDKQGSSLHECILNIEYLIASNLINYFTKKYIEKEKKVTDIVFEINKNVSINFCYQNIFRTIIQCIIWGLGGMLVVGQKTTIGNLYIIESYSGKLVAPVCRIIDSNLEIKKTIIEIERVYSLINKSFEKPKNEEVHLKDKVIYFQNIDFSYNVEDELFKGFNAKIYPRQVNVFIGKSGEGKTTIIRLLTCMWKVNSGKILIDNVNLYDCSKIDIRNKIAIVSQDVPIFNATIMENLVLSSKISIDDVIDACKLAGIYDEIMNKKEKFNTMISEYGRNLSGGQKQRIAITRALLKKAEILILDEPTASLDYENRKQIKKLIYNLQGKTVILVTHDNELIKIASHVWLLKDGKAQILRQ